MFSPGGGAAPQRAAETGQDSRQKARGGGRRETEQGN